jgi:hypothetical protein
MTDAELDALFAPTPRRVRHPKRIPGVGYVPTRTRKQQQRAAAKRRRLRRKGRPITETIA